MTSHHLWHILLIRSSLQVLPPTHSMGGYCTRDYTLGVTLGVSTTQSIIFKLLIREDNNVLLSQSSDFKSRSHDLNQSMYESIAICLEEQIKVPPHFTSLSFSTVCFSFPSRYTLTKDTSLSELPLYTDIHSFHFISSARAVKNMSKYIKASFSTY